MKYLILLCCILCLPALVLAQDTINPYNIQQHNTIELHGKLNVYYRPFLPPDSSCTRAQLSGQSVALRDSNGINELWPRYQPMVHATGETTDTPLYEWQPWGIPLGQYASWQRLFQALPKADGTPTDIIAGGDSSDTVTISANEDVDFRASGTIKLKNGFRADSGCFFHAYQDPKWDTAVFSDEFDSAAKFNSQWYVSAGWGGNSYTEGDQAHYDSLVRLVSDPDAHDGHAVDLMMMEDTNIDTTYEIGGTNNCQPHIDSFQGQPVMRNYIFATGQIRSCPFPWQSQNTPPAAYAHVPYGKYEIREKIPHTEHWTNNWGLGYGFEWDLNETWMPDMNTLHDAWGHKLRFGPYTGHFGTYAGNPIFYSSGPHWSNINPPDAILIDNVPYTVQFMTGHVGDTVVAAWYPWPSYITSLSGPVTFYYTWNDNFTADSLPWSVNYDSSDGKWDIFSAGYHVVSPGDTEIFSKDTQPSHITLHTDPFDSTVVKSFECHWDSSLNWPTNKGLLFLESPLGVTDAHSGNEAYGFQANEWYGAHEGYAVPYVPFDGNDTDTTSYRYHTFAMEWLPNEVRVLYDSIVMFRWPDRMVPPGNPYYDWVGTMSRSVTDIHPAQFDLPSVSDSLGRDSSITSWTDGSGYHWYYNSAMYAARKYFEHAAAQSSWPGFETFDGKRVAHHMLDYVKVWDVPKDVLIPPYPH